MAAPATEDTREDYSLHPATRNESETQSNIFDLIEVGLGRVGGGHGKQPLVSNEQQRNCPMVSVGVST